MRLLSIYRKKYYGPFLFFVILYGMYHTYYYDEILLGKTGFDNDIFTVYIRQHPLISAYLLIGISLSFIVFTSRRYISIFFFGHTEKRYRLFFAALFFVLSFVPTNSSSALFLIPFYIQTILFLSLVSLMTCSVKPAAAFSDAFNRCIFSSDKKVFLLSVFSLSLISTNIISYTVFDHMPHIEDSVSYLFQGTLFSQGRLYAQSPAYPEFFKFPHIIMHHGKWYSQYGPGHPLLLAAGVLLKAPWIINPVFNAATSVLLYLLALDIYEDEKTARIAALLSLLSPFLLFMSSEYMSHTTCLFFTTAFLLCFVRSSRYNHRLYTILAGFLLGYTVTVRQTTGFLLIFAVTIYILFSVIRKGYAVKKAMLFYVCLGMPILLLLAYNGIVNDNPLVFRYISKVDSPNLKNYGFGITKDFSYLPALSHSIDRINLINVFLFEWPIPSLFFASVALCGARKRFEYLLLLIPAVISAGYFSREYLEICFGPRYLYETSAAWILLSSRGMTDFFSVLLNSDRIGKKDPKAVNFTFFFIALLLIFCFGYRVPKLAGAYSNSYWRVDNRLQLMVEEEGINNAVIFIRDEIEDWNRPFLWGAGFQKNSPSLDTDIIYARDLDRHNIKLMELYPERDFYLCYYEEFLLDVVLKKITMEHYR